MTDPKYVAFTALDPFFEIAQQGLAGLVDGDHYFDTIADDVVLEFRYIFPGWPQTGHVRAGSRPSTQATVMASSCMITPQTANAALP